MIAEPVEVSFSQRWENWIRWCNAKGLYQGRVGSAEGGYSGPQGNGHPSGWGDWDEAAPLPGRPVLPPVDVIDALDVNRAYVRLATLAPTNARAIQVLVFQGWIKPMRQAQILGTHYLRLGELLNDSKTMLRNLLREG